MVYAPVSQKEEAVAKHIVLLSHLKLTGKRLGFLINFNVPLIKSGIRRFIV